MPEKNIFFNSAAKAGLALGGVSVAGMLIPWLLGKIGGDSRVALMAISAVNTLLWAFKLFICIYLMRFFMRRFSARVPEADNSRVFRFGALTALLSALVFSAFYMAYLMFIDPESYAFFSNLIYCTIYGTVLSAILSRNIPPRNPFAGGDFKQQ